MGGGFCIVFTMSFLFHSFALNDDKFHSLGDIHISFFICLIVSLWNNMIRSLSFYLFSPFKTFLVCMHFCYWTHTIICQLKLLYTLCINLVLLHNFFSLCVLQWNILIIFVGLIFKVTKVFTLHSFETKKFDELNECFTHTHTLSLPSNICKNIVRKSIASLHDSQWKSPHKMENPWDWATQPCQGQKIGCQTCDQSPFL